MNGCVEMCVHERMWICLSEPMRVFLSLPLSVVLSLSLSRLNAVAIMPRLSSTQQIHLHALARLSCAALLVHQPLRQPTCGSVHVSQGRTDDVDSTGIDNQNHHWGMRGGGCQDENTQFTPAHSRCVRAHGVANSIITSASHKSREHKLFAENRSLHVPARPWHVPARPWQAIYPFGHTLSPSQSCRFLPLRVLAPLQTTEAGGTCSLSLASERRASVDAIPLAAAQ